MSLNNSGHTVLSIDEEKQVLVDKHAIIDQEPSIDNNNIRNEEVVLLDISSSMKWISYVTNRKDEKGDFIMQQTAGGNNNDPVLCTYLTRRKFTELPVPTTKEDVEDHHVISQNHHFTLDITQYLKDGGSNHCKFLSISPDGDYIALSFFERNIAAGDKRYKAPNNPDCLVFKVGENGIKLTNKIKCQGRAVFLSQNNTRVLALINPDFLEVYDNFSSSHVKCSHWFDLRPLGSSSKIFHDRVVNQNSYIKSASWVNFKGRDDGEMKRLITYSRHVRNNVLKTPFSGGIVRVWSIVEDGVRLSSFRVQTNEHVMAFSNDNKYIATFIEGTKLVNVYEVKSDLLVYILESRTTTTKKEGVTFEVSQLRFFHDDHYLVMSAMERNNGSGAVNKVFFEVWYIKTEKSIHSEEYKVKNGGVSSEHKLIQPFVARGKNKNGLKCLYGVYTTLDADNRTKTICVELDIDQKVPSNGIKLEWIPNTDPYYKAEIEVENNLNQFDNLKCGRLITEDGRQYLIRFGKYMVQLWRLHDPDCDEQDYISEDDKLIYIRAYKGPNYGADYSFRETWMIHEYDSIKFVGGFPSGRMIVNIAKDDEEDEIVGSSYYTEELFLPFEQLVSPTNEAKYDYHQLESACQALHYQSVVFDEFGAFLTSTEEQYKSNRDMMYNKTKELINNAIININDALKNFFTTIAGSRTLAMLASFDDGRDIIKTILTNEIPIPIRIFSHPRSYTEITKYFRKDDDNDYASIYSSDTHNSFISSNLDDQLPTEVSSVQSYRNSPQIISRNRTKKKKYSQSLAPNENVLTVLAEETSYILFKLLYNRILGDTKEVGLGCLSTLTDTIFFLQSMQQARGDSYYTLIVGCIQKLTFLSINKDVLAVLRNELNEYHYKKAFSTQYSSSLIYLDSFSAMEQITRYNNNSIGDRIAYCFTEISGYIRSYFLSYNDTFSTKKRKRRWIVSKVNKGKEKWSTYQHGETSDGPAGLSLLCVVPLIGFNSYDSQHQVVKKKHTSSVFEKLVSDKHNSTIFQEGGNVIDILLQNKWKNFARSKFALLFLIHFVFYATYIGSVSFSHSIYGYTPGSPITHAQQIACTAVMFTFICIIFVQNIRRLFISQSKLTYFTSAFNFFDILAVVVVPVLTFLFMLYDWPNRKELTSICTLILWGHAILKLRIFPFIGVTLETIVQLWQSVAPVFAVMLLVICAFTNAYMELLDEYDDSYFQEKYAVIPPSPDAVDGVSMQDASANNPFTNVFKAFYTVWFFMYGVWDPANNGDAGDNVMIMILAALFTFFTVLIFFNLTIARMSGAVERVTKLGDKIWITHFAAVLSEIELLWCTERGRRNRENNPEFVFYNANAVSISKHGLLLRKETSRLEEALRLNHEFVEEFGAK